MNSDNAGELKVFIDLDVWSLVKEIEMDYVYQETGLTLETLQDDNDCQLYDEVAQELIPKPLKTFLSL